MLLVASLLLLLKKREGERSKAPSNINGVNKCRTQPFVIPRSAQRTRDNSAASEGVSVRVMISIGLMSFNVFQVATMGARVVKASTGINMDYSFWDLFERTLNVIITRLLVCAFSCKCANTYSSSCSSDGL